MEEYITMEELKQFRFFSDDFIYKKYLLGFEFHHNGNIIEDVEYHLKYYILSHNTVYRVEVNYCTGVHSAYISDFIVTELKNRLRMVKRDISNDMDRRYFYIAFPMFELSQDDALDLINHPQGGFKNVMLDKYIHEHIDSNFTRNQLSEHINYFIMKTRAR